MWVQIPSPAPQTNDRIFSCRFFVLFGRDLNGWGAATEKMEMRCNSCRQTVDTYRLPHRRDSNRIAACFAVGKIAEQIPSLRPFEKEVGTTMKVCLLLFVCRCATYAHALRSWVTLAVARYSVATLLTLAPQTKGLPKRFYEVKDFWEEEKPTDKCDFAIAKCGEVVL